MEKTVSEAAYPPPVSPAPGQQGAGGTISRDPQGGCTGEVRTPPDKAAVRDGRILARFIEVYCRGRHRDAPRQPVEFSGALAGVLAAPPVLCESCSRLLVHGMARRLRCPMKPKPPCRECTTHCFQPGYREEIREVMRYAGWRLVLRGRLDYLWRLLARREKAEG
jgi:hypothetical protein